MCGLAATADGCSDGERSAWFGAGSLPAASGSRKPLPCHKTATARRGPHIFRGTPPCVSLPLYFSLFRRRSRMTRLDGGCHCAAVRFEVDVPSALYDAALKKLSIVVCNCSICRLTGYLHLIVPKTNFKLLAPEDTLARYTFNTHIAQHYFCKRCGIKSWYIPRSNPDCVSVNARCIDNGEQLQLNIENFDGRHWEESAEQLKYLSGDQQSTGRK